jgi:YidC/Oxa1 family membrane protein insertase
VKFLERTRLAVRESVDMGKLLTLSPEERSVVVYAEDTFSYIQLKGYLNALWDEHGISYQYVTSDPGDPLLDHPPPGGNSWFVREQLARLLSSLECKAFITTMPDLGKFHVPRPKAGRTIYVFHSLNSTHSAYRRGAFDHYDQFLCTGPHHVAELQRLRADSLPVLSEVGYYKLDLIREDWKNLSDDRMEEDLVVVAPSWGNENLLETVGSDVVSALLKEGFRVIVRPHPQFFHSLYQRGREVVDRLMHEFNGVTSVEFELTINSQDSFLRSALMVSDWSGAAYEYALGTGRPVLFVDVPQKIFNDDWQQLGLPSFEREMRSEVGEILLVERASDAGTMAKRLTGSADEVAAELDSLARRTVFNVGGSASAGAVAVADSL